MILSADAPYEAVHQGVLDVLGKLEAHGSTDALALFFAERGIRGVLGCSRRCPVSQYLQAELGRCEVEVSHRQVFVPRGAEPAVYLTVPPTVSEFIARFDDHQFPELAGGVLQEHPVWGLVVIG